MTRIKFVNSNPCLSVFFEAALIAMICVQWSDVLGNVVYKSTEVQITFCIVCVDSNLRPPRTQIPEGKFKLNNQTSQLIPLRKKYTWAHTPLHVSN